MKYSNVQISFNVSKEEYCFTIFVKHWTQPVKGDQLNMVKLICDTDYISGFEHICDADHILIFLWHWFSYLWHWLIDLRATLNMPLGSEESVECSEEQGGVFCISLFFLFSLFSSLSEFFFALFTWLTKVSPPPPAWTWCAASWPPSTPCWWPASCSTSPAYPSTCSAGAQCHLEIQISIKLGQGSQFHLKSKYS